MVQRTGDWGKTWGTEEARGMEDRICNCSYGVEMDLISGIR